MLLFGRSGSLRLRGLAVVVVFGLVVSLTQVLPGLVSPGGSRASASAASGAGGLFVAAQGRILDTRNGTGGYSTPMPSTVWRSIPVDGQVGIPSSGVSAVAVDFTVLSPTVTGQVHADKDGVVSPNTSVTYVNYNAGVTASNSAVIAVGDDGKIQVLLTQSANLLIDVQGYYTAGSTAAGGYVPTTATTIGSTVTGTGGVKVGKIASGGTLQVTAAGVSPVPATASGVMLDVTESNATSTSGYLTVYPKGTSLPTTSLDWPASQSYGWTTAVSLASSGTVNVFVGIGGPVDITVAVEGYFTAVSGTNPDGQFTPAAARVYDSRTPSAAVAPNSVRTIPVGGINGVPVAGSGITAVAVDIAVLPGSASGQLQPYADNASPGVLSLPFYASTTLSTMVIVPLGSDGGIDVKNGSGAAINVVVDVEGWYSTVGAAVPAGQTRTQSAVTLQATATGGGNWVTYNYRVGSTGTFTAVPAGAVTTPGTNKPLGSWPVTRNGGGTFDPYTWNLASTVGSTDALVQIEACFGSSSTDPNPVCSMPSNVAYSPSAFGDSYATENVGPGSLSLLTGDYEISATDANAATSLGGLSVGRTLTTLAPADAGVAPGSQRSGAAGVFGPGWTADLSGPDAGDASLAVTDDSAQGYLVFTDTDGGASVYQATSALGTYPISFAGVDDAAGDGTTVRKTGPSTIIMNDSDGTATTWTLNASRWAVTSVVQPGTSTSSSYTYNVSGQVTRIVAPAPVSCAAPTTTPGCRSLSLTYGPVSVAGTSVSRLLSVSLSIPQTGTPNDIPVAAYDYNTAGQLADAYDPRISPALKTAYTYDLNGRLATLTPPGQAAWTFAYNSGGQLSTVSRPDPSGATATSTIVYNVAFTGTGAPVELDAATTATWAQTADLPTVGTAIFDADHNPAGTTAATVAAADWPYATIHYLDVNGREVNTAEYGAGAWQVDTHQFDANGNDIWDLTAANQAQALTPTPATDGYVAAQTTSAARANLLASSTLYSPLNPSEVTDTFGPTHPVTLSAGTVIDAQEHVATIYDEGAPNNDIDPNTTAAYALPTTVVTDPYNVATGTDNAYPDAEITHNGYAAVVAGDTDGWTLRQATTVTTQMGLNPSAADLVKTTRYNSSGQTMETRLPAGAAGGTAQSTITTYYTASGSGSCVSAVWAGLVCSTAPAAQPTTGNPLPVTTYTYDQYGDQLTKTETYGTGGGATVRTTTNSYDTAGRQTGQSVAVTPTAAGGTAVPAVTYGYDPTTGLQTTVSTTGQTLTTGYDNVGRVTSYTDATGNTATKSYDLAGNVTSSSDGKGTTTYTYDSSSEHRGLVTSENLNISGQPSTFTASYDPAGNLATETYPNGLAATTSYDNTDNPTALSYALGGTTWMTFTAARGDQDRIVAQASPQSSQTFGYDPDGRLATVADTTGGSCTTRVYGFDADSNRTSLTTHPATTGGACSATTTPTVTATSYDQADRDTNPGYAYDPLGRTTTVPAVDTQGLGAYSADTGNLTVGYYSNDMVASETQGAATLTYTLDPAQNRLNTISDGTTTTTNHYTSSGDSPAWTSTSASVWTRNLAGPDSNMAATVDQTGTVTLQLANLQGDIVATAADNPADTGITPGSYNESTEYGAERTPTTANTTYGWLGAKQRSSQSLAGLVLMGQRLYNPNTGRFLQVDPVPGGSANNYDYCNQDPINCLDLNGQWGWHNVRRFLHKHWRGIAQGMIIAGLALTGWGIAMDGAVAVGEVSELYEARSLAEGISRVSQGYRVQRWRRAVTASTGAGVGLFWGGRQVYHHYTHRWIESRYRW